MVRLPQKELSEVLEIVEQMLGANIGEVRSFDGKTRIGRILGKMKKRVWLRVGDFVVLVPSAFKTTNQTSLGGTKGTQVDWLKQKGYL